MLLLLPPYWSCETKLLLLPPYWSWEAKFVLEADVPYPEETDTAGAVLVLDAANPPEEKPLELNPVEEGPENPVPAVNPISELEPELELNPVELGALNPVPVLLKPVEPKEDWELY